MMGKLIKLSESHYIVVDDSEIKEGDWFYSIPRQTFHKCTGIFENNLIDNNWENREKVEICKNDCKKITHSTPVGGLSAMLEVGVKELSLSDAQEIECGYSIEKMARERFPTSKYHPAPTYLGNGYIEGFNAYKKLKKDKLFAEIDKQISDFKRDLLESGSTVNKQYFEGALFGLNRLKQSLLPKTEWEIKEITSEGKIII